MSKTKEATLTKEPRTVQVKLLVPYAIIVIMAVLAAGVISGWFMRSEQLGQVQREAAELVSQLKTEK
jgi:Tfp pilus assembly protein FimT